MAEVVDDSMTVIVELKTTPVPDPDCYAGETKTELCNDGSTIITHTCVNEKWSATNNTCPEEPSPDCYVGETKTKLCSDGSTIITHTCVDGKFSATNNVCPEDDKPNTMMYVVIVGAIILLYIFLRR